MGNATKKRMAVSEKQRRKVFESIIDNLNKLNDKQKRQVAEEAEVHWVTLYNWCAYNVWAPRLDTFSAVAEALGYELTLTIKKRKSHLSLVK